MHRANSIVHDQEDLKNEREHIRKYLHLNGYPDWFINKAEPKVTQEQEVVAEERPLDRVPSMEVEPSG